ncbi:chemotaxis protein [Synechococcus sp. AH-779-G23]|nr:chemotaxis protein [Synechococcus sp. AH-779-G23]MDA9639378.1 chemotaxis protein [Synechococcus sp. AH-779-G23]
MTQSVSFRITRTAEDVAQTLNALSLRLIKLENRLESLELQLERQSSEVNSMPADEMERLDGVDRLLTDCRDLLLSSEPQWVDQSSSVMSSEQDLAT